MEQENELRRRFEEMDTPALNALWIKEARLPWAEQILRNELLSRGIEAAHLDQLASRREEIGRSAPPSASETIFGYGFLGRAGTVFIAICVANILSGLFNRKVATVGVLFVVLIYLVVLVRRVSFQLKHPTTGGAAIFMVYQCAEAIVIAAAGVYVLVLTFSSGA